ncbi:hypothetical protein VB780_11700 [Leptolyngbya sp. CCNP1308]|nr:hypothetical protein [Leptolyngbya sp. CCNP1308]MEA5449237.1 hypothetical protein [Leptolyngbya sp. CCNP1308]
MPLLSATAKPFSLGDFWEPPPTVPTAATFDPAILSSLPPWLAAT